MKNIENLALTAGKLSNGNLKVHVVCSGMPYGNGEASDVFYEFFRRAWLSLHADLAALPVVGTGANRVPTVHVEDLSRCLIQVIDNAQTGKATGKKAAVQVPEFPQYLVAVDACEDSSQGAIMKSISSALGSGAVKNVPLAEVIDEEWSEFLTIDLKFKASNVFLVD